MSEIRRYLAERNDANRLYRALNRRVEQTPREKFDAYDQEKWEHTYFDEETGGFVVTDKIRIAQGKKERDKFEKEMRAIRFFASHGLQIEYLEDKPSTYDVNVVGKARFTVNGHKADLKSTKSGNNIVDYAKHAVRDQGADFVLIEFQTHHKKISEAISEMKRNHIKGYYYFMGEDTMYEI